MLLISLAFCTPLEARWAKVKRIREDHVYLKRWYYFFQKSQFEALPIGKAFGSLRVLLNAAYFPGGQEHGHLVVPVESWKFSTYSSVICSKNKEKKPTQLPIPLYKLSLAYQYHHLQQEEFLVQEANHSHSGSQPLPVYYKYQLL